MINVFAISMIHGFRGLSSSEGFESPAAKLWLTMDLMTASAFEHSVKSRRCSLGVPRLPVLLRLMTGACSSGAPARGGRHHVFFKLYEGRHCAIRRCCSTIKVYYDTIRL